MASLPSATTTVSELVGAVANGIEFCSVIAPVATAADTTPRLYGGADAIFTKHGMNEGLEYSTIHFSRTRKPVIFTGIPIVTPGAISRENKSGNSGSSVSTLSAGGTGVLAEHDGKLTVITGGTVGTDQILLGLSMNGGRQTKRVRLGTATGYTIPYFGVSVAFTVGTLTAGETIHTWHGSAPLGDSSGWQAAREALASQQRGFTSIVLCEDMSTDTQAAAFNSQLEAYKTANERFTLGRISIRDRLPLAELSHTVARMTGSPVLTFAEVGSGIDTVTRATGSWLADGMAVGDTVTFSGTASNNVTGIITVLTPTVLTTSVDLADEVTIAGAASAVAYPTITFAEVGASADTITRSRGSWLSDGFRVGDNIAITGSVSNNITTVNGLAVVTALVLTLGSSTPDDLAAEVITTNGLAIVAGETKADWMAAADAEFASVDSAPHISIGAGRCFTDENGYAGWSRRVSASWHASWRQYQHDLHVNTWRKDDGPVAAGGLYDLEDTLVEWDDRVDGAAGSSARFTTMRSWANGPGGAFIARDLTRAGDASLRQNVSGMSVVNLACSINQAATETAAIGQSLILNDDGTATTDSLAVIQKRVNDSLELALLTDAKGEGPRASKAVWTPNANDIYNEPEPTMTGVLDLQLNGNVVHVTTSVRIQTNG